jgi:hypothetical protein
MQSDNQKVIELQDTALNIIREMLETAGVKQYETTAIIGAVMHYGETMKLGETMKVTTVLQPDANGSLFEAMGNFVKGYNEIILSQHSTPDVFGQDLPQAVNKQPANRPK